MNKTLVAAGVALACSTAFSPAFAADTIVDSDGKSASIITVRENKTISPGATGGGTYIVTNKHENTDKMFNFTGGTLTVSDFSKFSLVTDKSLKGSNAVALMFSNNSGLKVQNIDTVEFGTAEKPLSADQLINTIGSNSIEFSDIGTLSINTKAYQSVNLQAGSKLSLTNIDEVSIANTVPAGTTKGARGAVQIFTSSTANGEPAEFVVKDVGKLSISASGNGQATSIGLFIFDDSGKYQGTASAKVSIEADTISITGGNYGFVAQRTVTNSKSSDIKITAKDSINFTGGTYGVYLKNKTGESTQADLKAPTVTITGGYKAIDSTGTIDAQKTIITNASTAIDLDATSDLTLTNTANDSKGVTEIAGNVTSAGKINLKNQSVDIVNGKFSTTNLGAEDAEIIFHEVTEDAVNVNNLTKDSSLKVVAGSEITAKYGNAEAVMKALEEAGAISGDAKDTLTANLAGQESDLTSAWERDTNGKVTYANGSAESPVLTAAKHANAANLAQWRYEVNHLSDRLGDVRNLRGTAGTWARVYGAEAKVSDSVSTRVRADTLQVGSDVALGENWIVGAAFGYTDSDSDFTVGSLDTDAYTFALYGTGYFPCGGYVDIIGRMGRMSSDVTMDRNFTASYDNTAFGLSAEVGYEWNIAQGFYVTPQAELAYSYVKGDDYTAGNGVTVKQANFESLLGRLGVQAGVKFNDDRGNLYATVSVNHDFNGETEATATQGANAAQLLSEDLGGTWVSYGIGAQFNVLDNLAFYGSLTRANGSDYQENFRYSVGVRYVW